MPRLLSDTAALPCLLFAMVFDAAGRGRLWEGGGLPEPVAEGFLWLHLDLVDARLDGLIAAGRFGPPALAVATFARDGHQRVVIEGTDLGLVIADRAREFDGRIADEPAGRLHCVSVRSASRAGAGTPPPPPRPPATRCWPGAG